MNKKNHEAQLRNVAIILTTEEFPIHIAWLCKILKYLPREDDWQYFDKDIDSVFVPNNSIQKYIVLYFKGIGTKVQKEARIKLEEFENFFTGLYKKEIVEANVKFPVNDK